MVTLLRALVGFALGMVVFAGLLYFLVVVNFSQRLQDPEVYSVAISDTDAYNRIYDEVLVDRALEDQTANLTGDLDVEVNEAAVDILRDVMPPAYLQEQTENNIGRFTGFLRREHDDLEVYVDLEEPLGRIEPAVLGKVHQVIDSLEIEEPESPPGCLIRALQALAGALAPSIIRLSDGKLPNAAPSLNTLTKQCRETQFDRWFDLALNYPGISSQTALILERNRAIIRDPFIEGDTRAFLKTVAGPLVLPLIEDAIFDIRRGLQRNDRFDVLDWLAEESDDITRQSIEEQAESIRDVVSAANGSGRTVALVMIVVGGLLLAAVHVPRLADMLRWPGVTLLAGGSVCLSVGFVLNSAIPGQIRRAITDVASYSPDVPVSAINLTGDLMESFGRQVTAGFIPAAVTVMVLGLALIVASLFAGTLMAVGQRLLPRLNGGRGR